MLQGGTRVGYSILYELNCPFSKCADLLHFEGLLFLEHELLVGVVGVSNLDFPIVSDGDHVVTATKRNHNLVSLLVTE